MGGGAPGGGTRPVAPRGRVRRCRVSAPARRRRGGGAGGHARSPRPDPSGSERCAGGPGGLLGRMQRVPGPVRSAPERGRLSRDPQLLRGGGPTGLALRPPPAAHRPAARGRHPRLPDRHPLGGCGTRRAGSCARRCGRRAPIATRSCASWVPTPWPGREAGRPDRRAARGRAAPLPLPHALRARLRAAGRAAGQFARFLDGNPGRS